MAALIKYVQQSIAPRVQSGAELLAQFHNIRLLPTGCKRSASTLLITLVICNNINCSMLSGAGWLEPMLPGLLWRKTAK